MVTSFFGMNEILFMCPQQLCMGSWKSLSILSECFVYCTFKLPTCESYHRPHNRKSEPFRSIVNYDHQS
ncbi:hypothetical protein XENTR_v10014533 [Xenopus tropicalis]|nr:hypothetical protein XENTR_v10014533 [Xenopus tropicalis]